MKKIISIVLAVCIAMSVSITAFASESYPSYEAVSQQTLDAGSYVIKNSEVTSNLTGFFDLITLMDSEAVSKDTVTKFLNEALSNMKENDGKLLVYGEENMVAYLAVMEAANYLDIEDVGYDILGLLLDMDPEVVMDNPYYYVEIIPFAYAIDEVDFAKALAKTLTENYYVMGKGMNYYTASSGSEFFGCDNNAVYIAAVAPLYDDYQAEIEDAISIVEDLCAMDGGYCADFPGTEWYYPAVSSDSTALMLRAYSYLSIFAQKSEYYLAAAKAYNNLTAMLEEDGGYTGWNKAYSTMDAIRGLYPYSILASIFSTYSGWYEDTNTGDWYYFGDNTIETGWVKSPASGRWYYMDENTGIMQTGWVKVENKWYYLNSQGAMQKGWVNDNGIWYFLKGDGSMATGWVKDNGKWYYTNTHGTMLTGWQKINGTWYYLNASGSMRTGWLLDNGKWYYLNASGAMRTADLTYKGKVYHFNSSGACTNP